MCFFPVYVKKMDGDRGGFGDIGGGIGAGGQQDKGQNKVRFCIKKIYDCIFSPSSLLFIVY